MEKKLENLLQRLKGIEQELGEPEVLQDQKKYRELTEQYSYISKVKEISDELEKAKLDLSEHQAFLAEDHDEDFLAVIQKEIAELENKIPYLETQLVMLLIPPDPNDHKNTILELRAGTGGDEAALFVGDCMRMYKLYADSMGWKYEVLSSTPSDIGGFKEYVMVLSGRDVYRYLKYEAGTHRVQRIPATEAQGRIHTSAITVAVLLEPDEEGDVVVSDKDLRVDTYRSSGAGGQHVNTTDSAVRLTHLPTGIVVYCQDERSQHKNKDKAMRLLKAKIAEAESKKRQQEIADNRAQQVGSGDRSERIRTYNFPQNRITDHRVPVTRYNLDLVMNGDLKEISEILVAHFAEK